MAIVEDASSPAQVFSNTVSPQTTASFTPPSGSLVVAIGQAGTATSGTTTATISSSDSVTWTTAIEADGLNATGTDFGGSVTIAYHYYVTSPGAITVSNTTGGSFKGNLLNVVVLTGTAASSPFIGGTASTLKNDNTTAFTTTVTTTASGSRVYGGASSSDGATAVTADNSTFVGAQQTSAGSKYAAVAFKSTADTTTPGSLTLGVDGPANKTGGPVAVAEILPFSAPSDADTAAGAEGNPTVAFSAPDIASGVETALALGVSAVTESGAGAESPGTIAAALSAPDSGAGVDTSTITANLSTADTGSSAESGSVLSVIAKSDGDVIHFVHNPNM